MQTCGIEFQGKNRKMKETERTTEEPLSNEDKPAEVFINIHEW